MTQLSYKSANELAQMILNKEISSSELLEYYISRVEKFNPDINAIIVKDYENAKLAALRADDELSKGNIMGLLHGVPMTIKDSYDLAGTVTSRGIFKEVYTITPSASLTGNVTAGLKAADSVIVTGQLELSSSNSFTVVGEDGKGLFEASPGAATLDKLEGVNVKTRQSSVDALRVIDRSLDRIHKERAKLGALMSRMEKAIDNLSNVALNTEAARGRIQDADFAKESSALTKAQILQQSAMAMIAQAGKAQQNILQLLQQ